MSPPPRIDGILATEAPVAVAFRRGPSKLTQQLLWNLETDEVTPGQWIKGRVYTRRCDLSPDGRHLVGAYTNYSSRTEHKARLGKHPWSHCGWTAVSRPPYYTAVALWFTGDAWNCGGIWHGRDDLGLNEFGGHWEEALKPPRGVKVRSLRLGPSEDEPIFSLLLRKRGWKEKQPRKQKLTNPDWKKAAKRAVGLLGFGGTADIGKLEEFLQLVELGIPRYDTLQEAVWVKPFVGGRLERVVHHRGETWSIKTERGDAVRTFRVPEFGMQWLDIDIRGRVVFGDQGQLWAWGDFPEGTPKVVADLRENTFEPVPPPDWATRW